MFGIQKTTTERPQWKRPSIIEMAAMTAIPVAGIIWFEWGGFHILLFYGIIWFEWSGFHILLLYWYDNALIGVFNILRMVLTKPVYRNRADYIAAHPWILQHYSMTDDEWAQAKQWELPGRRHDTTREDCTHTYDKRGAKFLNRAVAPSLAPQGEGVVIMLFCSSC